MREMKDSGVEWIGEIPVEWKVTILSALFSEHKCKNIGMVENNLLSLSYGKIKKKNIESNEGLLPESFETYNIIEPGNIVLRLTDLQNDKKSLRTGLCKERGIITSAYVTLEIKADDIPQYMHYLFHSCDLCKVFYSLGDGVRQGMNYSDLKRLNVIKPSVEEQQRIADYLDSKCSKIDSIIAKQEEIIEKLKEYKLSVITEAVTKGLNPDVEMKDSDNEKYKQIPIKWTLIKGKYILSVQSGDAIAIEDVDPENIFPVYGGGECMGYTSKYNIDKDKLIVGRVGARCGCVTRIDNKAWATDNALVVTPVCNRNYLFYVLIALNLNSLNTSNAQPLITGGKLKGCIFPYTRDTSEQREIADFLDMKCNCIDSAIVRKSSIITKLQEYKKSLIYEVVTGKREM